MEHKPLEIQAYDELCFPGWQPNGRIRVYDAPSSGR